MPILRNSTSRLVAAAMLALATLFHPASANDAPLRMVVGFVPGGANDVLARLLSKELSQSLKQPVIVENKPGAGGMIGADAVAKARADGRTLLLASSGSATIAPGLTRASFDPRKDLAPVALIADSANVLIVGAQLPYRTLQDLIQAAKAAPGRLNYASSGNGTTLHMSGALFARIADVNISHVAYKGNSPALSDIMSGQVEMGFVGVPAAITALATGKVRAIAVTSDKRVKALPNVPTMQEAGLPKYRFSNWFGVFTTGGTNPETIERLAAEISAILKKPAVQEAMLAQGAEVRTTTPQAFRKQVDQELAEWESLIKTMGITAN